MKKTIVTMLPGNLANVLKNQGKYEEAENLYQEAMQIEKESLGENHHDYATECSISED
jgi:tetratricopeptide (TPR) repeat protein